MALTPEQQEQIDISNASSMTLENARHSNQLETEYLRIKLETVRLAKETLIENARSQPVELREITAANIIAFANTLDTHIKN